MADFFSAQAKASGATKKKKSSFGLFRRSSGPSVPSPAPQTGSSSSSNKLSPPPPPSPPTASYDVVEEYIYVEGLKPPPSPIATPRRKTQAAMMAVVPREEGEEDFEYAAPKSPIVSPRATTAATSTPAKSVTAKHSAVDEHMFFSSGGGGGGGGNGDDDEDAGFDNPLHMDAEPESHSLNAPPRSTTTSKRKTGSIKSTATAATMAVGSKKELDYDMVFKPSKNKQEAKDANLANEEEFIQAGEFEW